MQVNFASQFMIARDFVKYRLEVTQPSGQLEQPGYGVSAGKLIFLASNACFQGGVAVSG